MNLVRAALAACRGHFLYAALFSGLINVLYLAPSIFMLQVYDRVVPTRGTPTLALLLVVLAFALVVLSLMDLARMQLLQRASVRLEKQTAGPLLNQILGAEGVPQSARAQAVRDFDVIRGTLTGPAVIALFDAPWAPIYIIVSFMLHPLLGALALFSAVALGALAWVGERSTQAAVREANARHTEINRMQDFSLQASDVARALGMRKALVRRHLVDRAGLTLVQGQVAKRSATFLAVTKFFRLLLQSIALGVGAWLAIDQKISAGAIFAAALIMGRALQPIEQILGALKNILSARSAYRSLVAFSEAAGFEPERTALPAPEGRLSVEGIKVSVGVGERPILDNIALWAEPGELIALIGPSGSGKSTLLKVLAGALDPEEGEVRLDGARHSDWDRDILGQYIGYMPQDSTLFPASIHANICRLQTVSDEERPELDRKVVEAAQLAGAHDVILRLPKAYDTELGTRDGGLSAGQRQAVAFARALYDQPRLILLDEPNAHLDSEGEARMMAAFAELKRRKATIIVSTHRTGILQVADKVLVLRDGTVQAFGNRDDIVRGATPAVPAPEPATKKSSKAAAA
jgi:ATP-binding cassette subfamily C protein